MDLRLYSLLTVSAAVPDGMQGSLRAKVGGESNDVDLCSAMFMRIRKASRSDWEPYACDIELKISQARVHNVGMADASSACTIWSACGLPCKHVQSKSAASERADVSKPFHQVCIVAVRRKSVPTALKAEIRVEKWRSYKIHSVFLGAQTSRRLTYLTRSLITRAAAHRRSTANGTATTGSSVRGVGRGTPYPAMHIIRAMSTGRKTARLPRSGYVVLTCKKAPQAKATVSSKDFRQRVGAFTFPPVRGSTVYSREDASTSSLGMGVGVEPFKERRATLDNCA